MYIVQRWIVRRMRIQIKATSFARTFDLVDAISYTALLLPI